MSEIKKDESVVADATSTEKAAKPEKKTNSKKATGLTKKVTK